MTVEVTIDRTPPDAAISFVWECTSAEARKLWEDCETMADGRGMDPKRIAGTLIRQLVLQGEPGDEIELHGLRVWVVYAVLRFTADDIDVDVLVDHAGVLGATPTVFDLAGHQQIKAAVRVADDVLTMKIEGKSMLDS